MYRDAAFRACVSNSRFGRWALVAIGPLDRHPSCGADVHPSSTCWKVPEGADSKRL